MDHTVYHDTLVEPSQPFTNVERNDGIPPSAVQFYCHPSSFVTKDDWLEDELGWGRWNSCSHSQRWVTVNQSPWAFDYYPAGNGVWYRYGGITSKAVAILPYGPWDSPNGGLPIIATDNPRQVPLPTDWKSYVDRSLRAMLPGIRPRLSLVNSILELKDFQSLPELLGRVVSDIRRIQGWIRTGRTLSGRRTVYDTRRRRSVSLSEATIRALARQLSGLFLQSEFNIRPLLSDVCGVRTSLLNIRKQINHLLANEGTIEKRHYSCPLSGFADETSEYQYTGATQLYSPTFRMSVYGSESDNPNIAAYATSGLYVGRSVANDLARFSATIEYSYTLTGAERANAHLRGLLDSLGVNFNPAILWNAIRWSFLVDWVFGVSQWLDQFKERLIEPRTVIHRYCASIHVKRRVNTHLRVASSPYHEGMTVPAVSMAEESYRRVAFMPDWQYSLEASGINSREFILSSALAASRR